MFPPASFSVYTISQKIRLLSSSLRWLVTEMMPIAQVAVARGTSGGRMHIADCLLWARRDAR